jgi:hypothetical protein
MATTSSSEPEAEDDQYSGYSQVIHYLSVCLSPDFYIGWGLDVSSTGYFRLALDFQ